MSLNRHHSEPRRRHQVVVADVGCGCGGSSRRNKSKLSSIFFSRANSDNYVFSSDPKPKLTNPLFSPSTISSSTSTTLTTTSLSSLQSYGASEMKNDGNKYYNSKKKEKEKEKEEEEEEDVEKKKRSVSESFAVVKDSEDPYRDFKDCMLVMIVEKELYSWEDLRELLHKLLELNSSENHHVILLAFSDLCAQLFSPTVSDSGESRRRPSLTIRGRGDV